MIFFVLMCFQDEIKQLSSWKVFDWKRFGNRFGNDVFEIKKLKVFQGFTHVHSTYSLGLKTIVL